MKETKSKAKKESTKKLKKLTLDEIEERETQLILESNSTNFFINSKKIEMLDKLAQQKLKRMQVENQMNKDSEEDNKVEPITVKFVSSNTPECMDRVERIKNEILSGGKNDA